MSPKSAHLLWGHLTTDGLGRTMKNQSSLHTRLSNCGETAFFSFQFPNINRWHIDLWLIPREGTQWQSNMMTRSKSAPSRTDASADGRGAACGNDSKALTTAHMRARTQSWTHARAHTHTHTHTQKTEQQLQLYMLFCCILHWCVTVGWNLETRSEVWWVARSRAERMHVDKNVLTPHER